MFTPLQTYLTGQGLAVNPAGLAYVGTSLLVLFLLSAIIYWITKSVFIRLLEKISYSSFFKWDDVFIHNHFFKRLAPLPSLLLIYGTADLVFSDYAPLNVILKRASLILLVITTIRLIDATLRSFQEIYNHTKMASDWPVKGYIDAFKIINYVIGAIFIISILTGKSPWGIISIFGGLTAVLLLIFKDTILGFVANLQLTANDMIRVGDWVEMPKRGADGDVIDISLHTVKVQNWDKTITTIPTYHLVNEDFKNWRGMTQSGGRRIKRAIFIDMSSITFCTREMLEKYKKYILLEDYLQQKEADIENYNKTHHPDPDKFGGRRQTNIGIFRAYIQAYLRNNPNINQELTFLVRHLAPTAQGLPIEIYVFSADKKWANYEAIQADIFDHLLAIAPEFGLRVFQYPSGYDLSRFQRGGENSVT